MKVLLLFCVVALAAANAALIPSLDVSSAGVVISTDPGTGDTTYGYTYLVTLNPSAELTGTREEYFTIYDFPGFMSLASVVPPGGWTVNTNAEGLTPPGITVPMDDPTLDNLTFSYSGPAAPGGSAWAFTLYTSVGPYYTNSYFSSQATNSLLPTTYVRNYGDILVPSPDSGDPVVPEPLTMGLLGGGLAAIGLLRRYRSAA